MAVVYSTTLKNTRLDAVTTAIGATGQLLIGTAGMATTLATITLSNPAAAAAASGVLTLSGFPKSDTSADATGTPAAAKITDGTNDVVTGLTVGTATTANIVISSTAITAGETVTVNSGVFTHG